MKFIQFDPRPQSFAANASAVAEARGNVLGIEVTEAALLSLCPLGNLDHHGPDSTSETPSSCEQALAYAYDLCHRPCCGGGWDSYYCPECDPCQGPPPTPKSLGTIRPDSDSITAMAVILNRITYRPVDANIVRSVGLRDRLGPAAGKPLPVVVAIARKACDFKVAMADRVAWVSDLLAGADKSAEIAEMATLGEAELAAARKVSELTLHADGRIVSVVSTNRFATTLGYESAPVVVAMNPSQTVDPKDPAKGTYRKFTICRYDSHVACDLPEALRELQAIESGWGGRGDIFGSPQGVSSKLTLNQVIEVVSRHLK